MVAPYAQSPMPTTYSFMDFAKNRARLMPELPVQPAGSGASDSFGAVGNGKPAAAVDAAAVRRPVMGALTAIGILIAFRVLVELAEDAVD